MAHQTTNHRRPNGRAQAAAQTAVRNVEDQAEEVQSSVRNMAGQVADQASEYWNQGRDQMQECIRGREGAAVLMAAAAGIGVGLVVGAALGRSHKQQLTWRDRVTAEGFGRRLMERIESMVPDALSEHFSKK
jgi:sugar (pentulose or hexulose) kinase